MSMPGLQKLQQQLRLLCFILRFLFFPMQSDMRCASCRPCVSRPGKRSGKKTRKWTNSLAKQRQRSSKRLQRSRRANCTYSCLRRFLIFLSVKWTVPVDPKEDRWATVCSPAEVQFVPTAVALDAELLHLDDGVWASEPQGASVPYWVQTRGSFKPGCRQNSLRLRT